MRPEEASTNGKIRYRFRRMPGFRDNDERFEGPALGRDAPQNGEAN
jgi:hypothetical protein